MAGGYDQFFKEARKASGLSTGKAPSKSGKKSAVPAPKKANERSAKPKFPVKPETPEDRIRAELAFRMQKRKLSSQKKRAKFPVFAAVSAVTAFLFCGAGYFYADQAEALLAKTLGHFEIGFFNEAGAETAKAKAKPKAEEKPAAAPAKEEKPADVATTAGDHEKPLETINTNKWTPEELSFFSKLNERKKELDLREGELTKLEEELQKRKLELDEKLKQLESMRSEISKTLKTRVASDQEKVDKLVQVYSTMKPQQASKIIETLDEDLAVEILDKMKKKSAAEILNMMDAKKARRLSELSTGYQRTAASVRSAEDAEPAESAPEAASEAPAKKSK